MQKFHVAPLAGLSFLMAGLQATASWAGYENKDRPATPINLRIIPANPPPPGVKPFAVVLTWTSPQIRTKPTFHDIHFRGRDGRPIPGMGDITGGAASPAGSLGRSEIGQFAIRNIPAWNPPESGEIVVSMRARTEGGTNGCISQAESQSVRFCGTPSHPVVCR